MPSDGDAITTWPDISGNHNDFDLVDVGSGGPYYKASIVNGLSVVRWTTQGNSLQGPDISASIPSAATVLLVWSWTAVPTSGGSQIFQDSTTFRDGWWYYSGDGNGYFTAYRSPRASAFPSPMPSDTSFHAISIRSDATRYRVFIDGTDKGDAGGAFASGASPNLAGVSTNSGTRFSGDIPELIIFNGYLSDADEAAVRQYLRNKYALVGSGGAGTPPDALGADLVVWLAPESFISVPEYIGVWGGA